VRPLYLRSENGKIPELKRVVVAYENKIAMEETLEAAIAKIFNSTVPASQDASATAAQSATPQASAEAASTGGSAVLLKDARDAYERAIQAQRQGDWAKYGEEIKRLGSILENLNRAGAASKK